MHPLTEKFQLPSMRRILYRFSVALKTKLLRSSCNVLHIYALFQPKVDYLEIFPCKITIEMYTEIYPIKAAMVQAKRQTEKHEAKWRSATMQTSIKFTRDSREGRIIRQHFFPFESMG
jgi:hypothetical protein